MDIHQLRADNDQRLTELRGEIEQRRSRPVDPAEWSPRATAPTAQPEAPYIPAHERAIKSAITANNAMLAEEIALIACKLERDLRGVIAALESRVTDVEMRLDQIEAETRSTSRSWFGLGKVIRKTTVTP